MYTFSFFTVIHFINCFEEVHAGNQLFRFWATSTRRGGERKQGGRREKEEQRRGNKDRDEERKWGGGRRRDKIGDRTGMRKGEETGRGEETKMERRAEKREEKRLGKRKGRKMCWGKKARRSDEDVSFSGLLLPTCGSCGFLISLNSSAVLIRRKLFVAHFWLSVCLLPSQTQTWPELSLRGASRRVAAPTSRSPPLRSPQQRADWWSRQHPVKQKPDGQFNDQVTSVWTTRRHRI